MTVFGFCTQENSKLKLTDGKKIVTMGFEPQRSGSECEL